MTNVSKMVKTHFSLLVLIQATQRPAFAQLVVLLNCPVVATVQVQSGAWCPVVVVVSEKLVVWQTVVIVLALHMTWHRVVILQMPLVSGSFVSNHFVKMISTACSTLKIQTVTEAQVHQSLGERVIYHQI